MISKNHKEIGKGAYGSVYTNEAGTHAWKTVVAEDLRWLREVYIVRYLEHPNIIKYDQVRQVVPTNAKNPPKFTLRMRRYARSLSHFPVQDDEMIMKIIKPLVDALAYCHANEVLHRDIKEDNILISFDEIGQISDVVLCDFGLSCFQYTNDQNLTRRVMTISHRPPELQLAILNDVFINYDGRVDVWSLCMMFANLICRKSFFAYVYKHRRAIREIPFERQVTEDELGGDECTFVTLLANPQALYYCFGEYLKTQAKSCFVHIQTYIKIIMMGIQPYNTRANIQQIYEVLFKAPPSYTKGSLLPPNPLLDANSETTRQLIILREIQHWHEISNNPTSIYNLCCHMLRRLQDWQNQNSDVVSAAICYAVAEHISIDHPMDLKSFRKHWNDYLGMTRHQIILKAIEISEILDYNCRNLLSS